ncbi:hypothetical protein P3X46_021877 [Hevea brasiliensis]|uniref:DNA-binding protein BIN4 n=1 Tax=Hevea brasiliensis TaxID=3981 RepID=A0ABQ9LKT1_HEVBR|nr:DNA-binding protein BIN4-like isoform X1 [Hevea brasiliensis]XP_057987392.1 DNA-binding protein BIN4-like isoform X1 [Hevea brasiliensis]KAJ9167211.1 hypothetical protein P3X46_021877 [Hevea brasiliensis]
MSSSREDSPDWLRCFQAPTHSTVTLSSDSDSLQNVSPSRDDNIDSQSPERYSNNDIVPGESGAESPLYPISKAKAPKRGATGDGIPTKNERKKRKKEQREGDGTDGPASEEVTPDEDIEPHAANHSVLALSSDSESSHDNSSRRETKNIKLKESGKDEAAMVGSSSEALKKALKEKSPKKLLKVEGHTHKKEKNKKDNVLKGDPDAVEVADEDTSVKRTDPHVSTSRLPLLLPEKVSRSKALVECEGDSIDLSGDVGAVGRVVIPDASSGNHDMYLDLKGTIYRTTIVPSRTFCVVSFGQSEAKIEAIMNDFIQLKAQSNVYEAETMVEGTLEGFSFDSEDEADKMPKAISRETDQNEGNEEQTNGRTKGKAEKSSGVVQKKGKTGGKAQPAKKVRKKAQVSKKTKTKK